jgi:hypothetical protein
VSLITARDERDRDRIGKEDPGSSDGERRYVGSGATSGAVSALEQNLECAVSRGGKYEGTERWTDLDGINLWCTSTFGVDWSRVIFTSTSTRGNSLSR